jgi:hypothetical protein
MMLGGTRVGSEKGGQCWFQPDGVGRDLHGLRAGRDGLPGGLGVWRLAERYGDG